MQQNRFCSFFFQDDAVVNVVEGAGGSAVAGDDTSGAATGMKPAAAPVTPVKIAPSKDAVTEDDAVVNVVEGAGGSASVPEMCDVLRGTGREAVTRKCGVHV